MRVRSFSTASRWIDAMDGELFGAFRRIGLPRSEALMIDIDAFKRYARVLRQPKALLRLGDLLLDPLSKIVPGHHHLARGAPPESRADALQIGEALVRAGLLGEKPSVGQRHVFLRRETLPAIHALIERGETADPALRAEWTAAAPGERT